jgi:hypothetical protein
MSKTLSQKQKDCEQTKKYQKTKRGHLCNYLKRVKRRALDKNLAFDLDLDYLESIATDRCPVFNTEFVWGLYRVGKTTNHTATVDRIVPELGYVKGNVVFLSHLANRIKNDVTEKELYAVADWLHDKRKEVLNAIEKQSTSVSVEHTGESQVDTESRTIHGAGVGKDCDGVIHHRGEPEGDNPCDSTQAGCRICMGSRGKQVEALELYENCQDYGLTETETRRLAECFGCICHQP